MFCKYLAGWPYSRDNREIDSLAWLFNFQHVLLTWPFRGLLFSQTSCKLITKPHWFFNSCSILHQLNTKSNTIKSHKIQGINLIQLQYFFSINKANIKYSCKSQLYKEVYNFDNQIDEIIVDCKKKFNA